EDTFALRTPQGSEFGAESVPQRLDRIEKIGAHAVASAGCSLMTGLGKIAHPEIGDQHADVEADRTVEREFRIDDTRLIVGHHNGTGVKVAVAECFGLGREEMFQPLRCYLELAACAQLCHDWIELWCGVMVKLCLEIGIGKDKVYRDVTEFDVVGKQGDIR